MNRTPSTARLLTYGSCLALVALLLVAIAAPSVAQDLNASEAYERGDYEATLREVRPGPARKSGLSFPARDLENLLPIYSETDYV